MPAAKGEVVVIESGTAFIAMESALADVRDALSVTCTVKVAAMAAVGVPLITPAADNVKPAGSVPNAIDHVYVGVPPVAPRVWEYAAPTVPAGSGDAVVIKSGGGFIVMENTFVAVREPLSVT